MDYTLAVLTHGDGDTFDRTLASFFDKVKPDPARVLVYSDGPWNTHYSVLPPHTLVVAEEQRGFCKASGRLWHWASDPGPDPPPYVFWLEHDFVFLRPVLLQEVAHVLDQETGLAQMQFMRTPVNPDEIAAGSLFAYRRGDYEQRHWFPTNMETAEAPEGFPYLHHRAYFTTNPSLMRTDWMAANPWPDDGEPHCEGRFGISLVERGFSFGVWGSGEAWVEHVGSRTGFGY